MHQTLMAADLLDASADHIQEHGWGKLKYQNDRGGVCAMGAVSMARTGDAYFFTRMGRELKEKIGGFVWSDEQLHAHIDEKDPVLGEAIRALYEQIGDAVLPNPDMYRLVCWNDMVAKSAEEVIAVLRATALLLRAKVEAPAETLVTA